MRNHGKYLTMIIRNGKLIILINYKLRNQIDKFQINILQVLFRYLTLISLKIHIIIKIKLLHQYAIF